MKHPIALLPITSFSVLLFFSVYESLCIIIIIIICFVCPFQTDALVREKVRTDSALDLSESTMTSCKGHHWTPFLPVWPLLGLLNYGGLRDHWDL
uniref:Uncharacterized protein n=1 Tax=Caenorhabditis japonica TaxID=281687 RepID=A0A8R1EPI9_CAEJA